MGEYGPIISALLALILALLSFQWKDDRSFKKQITEELKSKVDQTACDKQIANCNRGPTWDTFNRHSHEGLEKDSRVLRGE